LIRCQNHYYREWSKRFRIRFIL